MNSRDLTALIEEQRRELDLLRNECGDNEIESIGSKHSYEVSSKNGSSNGQLAPSFCTESIRSSRSETNWSLNHLGSNGIDNSHGIGSKLPSRTMEDVEQPVPRPSVAPTYTSGALPFTNHVNSIANGTAQTNGYDSAGSGSGYRKQTPWTPSPPYTTPNHLLYGQDNHVVNGGHMHISTSAYSNISPATGTAGSYTSSSDIAVEKQPSRAAKVQISAQDAPEDDVTMAAESRALVSQLERELNSAVGAMRAERQRAARAESSARNKEAELWRVNETLNAARAASAALERRNSELISLHEEESKAYKLEAAQLRAEVKRLSHEVSHAKLRESELQEASNNTRHLEESVAEHAKDLQKARAECTAISGRAAVAEAARAAADASLASAQSATATVRRELAELQERLLETQEEVHRLRTVHKDETEELSRLRDQVAQLESQSRRSAQAAEQAAIRSHAQPAEKGSSQPFIRGQTEAFKFNTDPSLENLALREKVEILEGDLRRAEAQRKEALADAAHHRYEQNRDTSLKVPPLMSPASSTGATVSSTLHYRDNSVDRSVDRPVIINSPVSSTGAVIAPVADYKQPAPRPTSSRTIANEALEAMAKVGAFRMIGRCRVDGKGKGASGAEQLARAWNILQKDGNEQQEFLASASLLLDRCATANGNSEGQRPQSRARSPYSGTEGYEAETETDRDENSQQHGPTNGYQKERLVKKVNASRSSTAGRKPHSRLSRKRDAKETTGRLRRSTIPTYAVRQPLARAAIPSVSRQISNNANRENGTKFPNRSRSNDVKRNERARNMEPKMKAREYAGPGPMPYRYLQHLERGARREGANASTRKTLKRKKDVSAGDGRSGRQWRP